MDVPYNYTVVEIQMQLLNYYLPISHKNWRDHHCYNNIAITEYYYCDLLPLLPLPLIAAIIANLKNGGWQHRGLSTPKGSFVLGEGKVELATGEVVTTESARAKFHGMHVYACVSVCVPLCLCV